MRSKRYTALIAFMSFVKHLMLIEEHSTTIFFETKKTNTMYAQQREVLRVAIQKVYDENRQIFGAGKLLLFLKNKDM